MDLGSWKQGPSLGDLSKDRCRTTVQGLVSMQASLKMKIEVSREKVKQ